MRTSSILISGAVAAVAVAGSAMGGAVDAFTVGLSGVDAVNGVVSVASGYSYSGWNSLGAGSLFNYRLGRAYGQNTNTGAAGLVPYSTAQVSGGAFVATFDAPAGVLGSVDLMYSMNGTFDYSSGPSVDMREYESLSFTISNLTGGGPNMSPQNKSLYWSFYNSNSMWTVYIDNLQNGTYTFSIGQMQADADAYAAEMLRTWVEEFEQSVETFGDFYTPFDFSRVAAMDMNFYSTGSGGFTFSGFSYTVPAPGAMALLGAAGLVGSRRRR